MCLRVGSEGNGRKDEKTSRVRSRHGRYTDFQKLMSKDEEKRKGKGQQAAFRKQHPKNEKKERKTTP